MPTSTAHPPSPAPIGNPANVTAELGLPVLRINAPDWYQREDWMTWLRNGATGVPDSSGLDIRPVATWYRGSGPPDEYSDVFFTYEEGEGSDSPASVNPSMVNVIPEDIWKAICELAEARGLGGCLVWVSNLN